MKKLSAYLIVIGLITIWSCEEKEVEVTLQPEQIVLTSYGQIIPITDSLVQPVIYQNVPLLRGLTVEETKSKFVDMVLPSILIAKYYLRKDRERVQSLLAKTQWNSEDSSFYTTQANRFRAKSLESLIDRMKTHPNSIVLAQAAVESGWGSSRFFYKANNLFGIWSYNTRDPRIAAEYTRGTGKVFLRLYDNIVESVTDYFETVGRSRAYRYFRKARSTSTNVDLLLPHLKYYSEQREAYVQQLKTVIAQNDFTRYDHYHLDPRYFIEVEH